MLRSVSKKLEVTSRKVSREWQKYRKVKSKILKSKRLQRLPDEFKTALLEEKRHETKQKISKKYSEYREFKFPLTHVSEFSGFRYSKRKTTDNSIQKYFKAGKDYNPDRLDNLIPKILDKNKVLGVLVVLEIYDTENDIIKYTSEFVTKALIKRLNEKGVSIYDYVAEKTKQSKSTEEFELRRIHIRVIYAKT
jgi:hypothetical protein